MLKSVILKNKVMKVSGDMESEKDLLMLLATIRKHVKNKFTVMIVINEPLKDFQHRLGLNCAEKVGFEQMLSEQMLAEKDELVYEFIGKMILDTYSPDRYYIKCVPEEMIYEIRSVNDED